MRRGVRAWVLGTPASGPRSSGRRHAQHRDDVAGSVTARSSGRATLVAMSQGDKFELQGEATTNPEREQVSEGGQKREHADDGKTAARETLCFPGVSEF